MQNPSTIQYLGDSINTYHISRLTPVPIWSQIALQTTMDKNIPASGLHQHDTAFYITPGKETQTLPPRSDS